MPDRDRLCGWMNDARPIPMHISCYLSRSQNSTIVLFHRAGAFAAARSRCSRARFLLGYHPLGTARPRGGDTRRILAGEEPLPPLLRCQVNAVEGKGDYC